jgi:GTP-binding protein
LKLVRNSLGLEKDDILIPFSAETKQGVAEVWKLIEELKKPEPENNEVKSGSVEETEEV